MSIEINSPEPLKCGSGVCCSSGRAERIKKRPDFLSAAKAHKWVAPGLILQARRRKANEHPDTPARIGFTVSKKVSKKAVLRNLAKRRLRAIADAHLLTLAREGWDYVLIARPDVTITRNFSELTLDFTKAMMRVHETRPSSHRPRR